MGLTVEDLMERTQWNIEIQNFSNDDGKSMRSAYVKKS